MAEQFCDLGALYGLENQQWKKIGNGTLKIITNEHNPSQIILKIEGKDVNEKGQIYQCKPKTKAKGSNSYILKGIHTRTHKESILAARFKSDATANSFRSAVEAAQKYAQKKKKKKHARDKTFEPSEIRQQLVTVEWDCHLCWSHNAGAHMKCPTCRVPRSIQQPADMRNHKKSMDSTELDVEDSTILALPPVHSIGSAKNLTITAAHIHGGSISSSIYTSPASPMGNGKFDWDSDTANDELREKPDPTKNDTNSSKKDFIRILSTIESNITHQDPEKLFEDLSKVAKRLQRKDTKYRTLDLKNPVVQERLMSIAGVDAYLKYLGFEEISLHKLQCPSDQPPRSVLNTAQEVCALFIDEWKEKQSLFQLLSESQKNVGSVLKENGHELKELESERKIDISTQTEEDEYTLRQLVWTITHHATRDENKTANVLLLSHGIFTESIDLLKVLITRFHGSMSKIENEKLMQNNAKLSKIEKDNQFNTQIKVGTILTLWMKTFWEQDFEKQPILMEELENFFESLEKEIVNNAKLKALLKKMRTTYDIQLEKYDSKRVPIKHKNLAHTFGYKEKNYNIANEKAKNIARQLTLMHFAVFKRIEKRECLGQAWKGSDREECAPNLLAMIKQFNATAKWFQILILNQKSLKVRSKVLRKCIDIAIYLKEYRNFSSCCAVHTALASTPIHRLKDCWATVPSSEMKKWNEIKEIYRFDSNWPKLRKLHREAHAPSILHTGIFLQDLVGIDEGNNDKMKNGRVNFKKLLRLFEKIDTMAMYQQEDYGFKEDLIMQGCLDDDFKKQMKIDDDMLFKISCSVKASDSKKKK